MPVTQIPAGGLGAAVSPEEWAAYVLAHLSAASVVLASGATRIDTALRAVHVPRVLSDGTAAWYGELEEITEAGPTGDELVLVPKKCATLCKLSSEVIDDSSPSVLDVVGTRMMAAVALTADRAILNGADPKGPQGVYGQAGQTVDAPVTISSLVDASGLVSDVGGTARVAYLHPADFTALQKESDQNGRPLISWDFSTMPTSTVYGMSLFSTKGIAQGTALVADPSQIVIAVRSDPQVAVSSDAIFTADGSVCRVICRLDAGVNDPAGLVSIEATAPLAAKSEEAPRGTRK